MRPPRPLPIELFRCPRCRAVLTSAGSATGEAWACSGADCALSSEGFPFIGDTPVLVDFESSILTREHVLGTGAETYKGEAYIKQSPLIKRLNYFLFTGTQDTADRAAVFVKAIKGVSPSPIALIVGGGSVGVGSSALFDDQAVTVVSTDIYRSEHVDAVADGHQLPFADGSVQGVWIQAVFQHVLDPAQMVAEICRVLAPGGIVYAETSFMQQVLEGGHDFIRFTQNGHRWLFRRFEEIDSGIIGGPGTVAVWAVQYLAGALFSSYKIGKMASVPFFWLRYLDRWANPKFASDGASGIYFLGRKAEAALGPHDIVSEYRGATK